MDPKNRLATWRDSLFVVVDSGFDLCPRYIGLTGRESRLECSRCFDADSGVDDSLDVRVVQVVVGFQAVSLEIPKQRPDQLSIRVAALGEPLSNEHVRVGVLGRSDADFGQKRFGQVERAVVRTTDRGAAARRIRVGCGNLAGDFNEPIARHCR